MTTQSFGSGRPLRPVSKVLPESARAHNLSLVLQTLLRKEGLSRADVARETGLTRVTVSDLVAELLAAGLVREAGQREGLRPGKPATVIELDVDSQHVIGLDLSGHSTFRGAVLQLDGTVIHRAEAALEGRSGTEALGVVVDLVTELAAATERPLLGIGVGSPGIVDLAGTVLSAPNRDWHDLPLRTELQGRFGVPAVVVNDADAAALAEHSFAGASENMMLVRIGHGVGAGLVLGGIAIHGHRHACGEIGHVTVGTDGGPDCVCGRKGCLEAWLSAPRLETALAEADGAAARAAVLESAGQRLAIALAPVVGANDLAEVIITGPEHLVHGPLANSALKTIRERTMPTIHDHVVVRTSDLGGDIVVRGAAAALVSDQLGVS